MLKIAGTDRGKRADLTRELQDEFAKCSPFGRNPEFRVRKRESSNIEQFCVKKCDLQQLQLSLPIFFFFFEGPIKHDNSWLFRRSLCFRRRFSLGGESAPANG